MLNSLQMIHSIIQEPAARQMNYETFKSLNNSRLINLLSDPNLSGKKGFQVPLAESLGQMLHFSSSINLLRALDNGGGIQTNPPETSGEAIRKTFLDAQKEMVRFIAKSFMPSARRQSNPLPDAQSLYDHFQLTGVFVSTKKRASKRLENACEPYRKFYTSRQTDLDRRIQHLHSEIRDMVSSVSPALAQLALIDQALFESLSDVSRESFAVIPALLGKRFIERLAIHRPELPDNPKAADLAPWIEPGGWISAFCNEMKELLLAELECRLQPVVGMIESLPQTNSANQTASEPNKNYEKKYQSG